MSDLSNWWEALSWSDATAVALTAILGLSCLVSIVVLIVVTRGRH